jgi:hypothetical protein
MVSELSAMGVLATTRRVRGGAGASAAACSACDKPPYSGKTERVYLDVAARYYVAFI